MSNQTDADVIVIGAGPSGSYAAKLLHDQGVRVKLVEAKDRVGGRTWSTKSDAPGGPIDFGGQWIGETHVLLPELGADGPEPDAAALARVMAELKRQTPKLSACYEKWLKANPQASGEVVLELTVSAQGRVKKARLPEGSKGISAASAECLVTTAKTLVLPPLGVEATLEQPLVLRPPGR